MEESKERGNRKEEDRRAALFNRMTSSSRRGLSTPLTRQSEKKRAGREETQTSGSSYRCSFSYPAWSREGREGEQSPGTEGRLRHRWCVTSGDMPAAYLALSIRPYRIRICSTADPDVAEPTDQIPVEVLLGPVILWIILRFRASD